MKKPILVLLLIGLVASIGIVSAFGGGFLKGQLDEEAREELRDAIEADDYDTWKSILSGTLTEENFNELVERYNQKQAIETAIENNDYDAWVAAMDDVLSEEMFDHMKEKIENRPPRGMHAKGQGTQGQYPQGQMQVGQFGN